MSSLESLIDRARANPIVRNVDRVPRGHVRIETSLEYPDESSIEVFIPASGELFNHRLTDFGQTMATLLETQVRPSASRKRQELLEETLRQFSVSLNGGAIECEYKDEDDFSGALLRLTQACFRTSDLIFTRRPALLGSFAESFEEFLGDLEVSYEPSATVPLSDGNLVRVDFLIRKPKADAAILTLSTGNVHQARIRSNEIFARWYDLASAHRSEERITVFNDHFDAYSNADLQRLENLSDVVAASDRSTIASLLGAAA